MRDDTRSSKEDVLSRNEIKELLSFASGIDKLIILSLIHCGLRASELEHMQRHWLHFDEEDNEFGVDYIKITKDHQLCDCPQCQLNAFIKVKRGDAKGKPKIKKSREWYVKVQREFHYLKAGGNLPELNSYWLPKTRKSARVIPVFNKRLIKMLKAYFERHDKFELNRFQIWERVKKVGKNALSGKRLYPHALRATCATNLAKRGFGAYDLTTFLGWESIATANSYVREDTHHMIKSLQKLENEA